MSRIITIEDLKKRAQELGGECLSPKYLGARAKHLWKGPSGKIFELQWNFVKLGKRWDKVSRNAYSIGSLKEEAQKRGGECLSTEYTTNKAKYKWKCSIGCIWDATWMDVLAGSWCPSCSKKITARKRADSLSDLKKHAENKKGKCLSAEYTNQTSIYTWKCDKGHEWRTPWKDIKYKNSWCPECPITKSKAELEILELVRQVHSSANTYRFSEKEHQSKSHIDIYIPSIKLGIEYNGLHWHHELANPKKYHANNKRLLCEQNGIRLITIFEDEWLNRKIQVQNFLKSVLGVHNTKIHGRACIVKEIPLLEAKEFLKDNHIQGYSSSIKAFGLFHEETLVGVMTAGKHHRGNPGLVLNRFAIKSDTHVPGGASKLLKTLKQFAIDNNYSTIVSWSDNRWSKGAVYKQLGFELEADLPPDYSYVDLKRPNKRIPKQSCKKRNLKAKGSIGNTELEMANSLGYSRIWDCGKKRWIIRL